MSGVSFKGSITRSIRGLTQSHPRLKSVFLNSGWIICGGIGNNILGLAAGVIIARYVGPSELGGIYYALSIITIATALVTLGLDNVALREISRHPEDADRYVTACFLIRAVASTLIFLAIALVAFYATPPALENHPEYLVILALGLFAPPLSAATVYFNSVLRSRVPQLSLLASGVGYLAAVGAAVALRCSTTFLVVLIMLRQLAAAVCVYLYYRKQIRGMNSAKSDAAGPRLRHTVQRLLRDGWPQAFAGIALLVQAYSDQIMLGEMLDLDSVAQYGVALKATLLLSAIPVAVVTSFSPSLAQRYVVDRDQFWITFHRVNRLVATISFALLLFTFLFGGWMIVLVYGESYALAAALIPVMAIRTCLAALGTLRGVHLVNANILRYSLVTTVIGCVLNVVLNLWAIPTWGVWGAVIASFVSFSASTIVFDLFVPQTRHAMAIALSAWFAPFLGSNRRLNSL